MTLNLQEVARAIGAGSHPPPLEVAGWSVDTRTQNPGDVYFALRGPNHDGHDFVAAAIQKGAAAVVVEHGVIPRGGTAGCGGTEQPLPCGRGSDQSDDREKPGRNASASGRRQAEACPTNASERLVDGGAGGFACELPSFAASEEVVSGAGLPAELVVPDSGRALQALGAWARRKWGGTVIGVTGSAGKTTTKDAIALLLSAELGEGKVGKTIGNFNNHVGVPLSLVRSEEHTSE